MDGSEMPPRYQHRQPASRQQVHDEFETPMGQQRDQGSGAFDAGSEFGLDASRYASGTPASRIAAGAVGRRLDLAPPQFGLHPPPSFSGQALAGNDMGGSSAFTTPVMQQASNSADPRSWGYHTPPERESQPGLYAHEEHDGWSPMISTVTPTNQLGMGQSADGPPTPFGAQPHAVDQEFILNLNQEGDLERLTRKAECDLKSAGKQLAMDELRKQVASLEDDEWIFASAQISAN
ncbi:hypothetical protein H4S02_004815 [Coemansia sp. RSA 2611]|nr:hypothetical protein H4S02_004815 [Coemansia sp. RSA 2611]